MLKNMRGSARRCQEYAGIIHRLLGELTPTTSPLLFAQWGVDLVGSPPWRKGGVKFVVVVMDHFTKWAEAKVLATITTNDITHVL